MSSHSDRMPASSPCARWWLLAVIAIFTVLAVVFIWMSGASQRQQQVLGTAGALAISFLLTLLWLVFFSRLRWKTRIISLAMIVLMLVFVGSLFHIRGVSGDFIPLLEWRWRTRTSKSVTVSGGTEEALWLSPNDYPQFLGPNRNATIHGLRLARDWSKHPPRLIWRQPIGEGWSAFAVVGNAAITQEQHGEDEMVVCYDLKSGQVKWSHGDHDRYESTIAGIGPRATPTIVKDRVYTLGGTGILNCLDLVTGSRIWSEDILYGNDAEINPWGMSGSPLVLDSLVVVSAGGPEGKSLVAYHKDTGERIWSGGSVPAGYSSPLITTLADTHQILIFNRGNVAAHDPLTGKILWHHSWANSECVAQPVPLPGNRVLVSSGYGIGCKLFQIERGDSRNLSVSLVWETSRLKAKFTNVVYHDDYIYGLDDGVLVCLDPTNGQRKWKRGRYGHGQMILVDDLLLVQAESGDVVLVETNPNAFKELTRFSALEGKTWNNPALAGPYLLVRNNQEAACYELPLAE